MKDDLSTRQWKDVDAADSTRLRRWLDKLTEPYFLFPAISIILLGVIWSATINLIHIELTTASRAAATLSNELAETYEAQVVRALREIDQTLKMVKYDYEVSRDSHVLARLRTRGLLPPEAVFTVSIADAAGKGVGDSATSQEVDMARTEYFQTRSGADTFRIGPPKRRAPSGEWKLDFSRRLNAPDGTLAGTATVTADAMYFVSGYDASKMGERGVLALIGTDGVVRARRTGEAISAGDSAAFPPRAPGTQSDESQTFLAENPWDGVRRFTSVRQLYEFPVLIVAGLSEAEQLAGVRANIRAYLWRAAAGSVGLLLVCALLGRASWQLRQSRLRAYRGQIDHTQRVEHLAYHDGLTKLPNRSHFSELLHQQLIEARRYDKEVTVLFLDLDRFKHINDTLGHDAGDELLKQVASRLRACLRQSDVVSRLGGDEFVVMLPELNDQERVTIVAQKVLAAIAEPFLLIGQQFRVTCSIGISTFPQHGLDEQTLTKKADLAMYAAKQRGKNNFQFYSDDLNVYLVERKELQASLRDALAHNEFRLHFQAKRDFHSDRITATEVLVRWQHPELGLLEPAQFIPVAEESGIIIALGKWMLKTVCLQNIHWGESGLPQMRMAVNLTQKQFFDDHLLIDLKSILEETGMAASLLELEIVESVLMHNVPKAVEILSQLKELGVRIAIDNFGTSYSSLRALKQFPIDTIKIDRSLVPDSSDESGSDLTDAIIAMSKTLSMTVVAQRVETREQAASAREQSYDEFQGFYFHKPVPVDQFTKMLREQAGAPGETVLRVVHG